MPAAAGAKDVTVSSFDGTKIAAHWFPGKGVSANAPAPTILEGPGWSQPGDSASGGGPGPGALFGVPGIDNFIDHGYNVLTWDPRGFGQSGGTVQIDDPRYEGRDVEALIDWVAKQPEVQLDQSCTASKKKRKRHAKRRRRAKSRVTCATSPNDPTIGMAGASYGGGIQLVSAALDKRIDAIAPTISWHSLLTSLFPNGNIKFGLGIAAERVGRRGEPARRADLTRHRGGQAGPVTSIRSSPTALRAAPFPRGPRLDGLARARRPGQPDPGPDPADPGDRGHALPARRGGDELRPDRRQPVADLRDQGQGEEGEGQEADEAAPRTAVENVPVKMLWFCGGHGVCLTDDGPGSSYLDQRQLGWFDRYLRGRADADTGPKFAWIADDGQLRSSDAYPLRSAGQLSGSGSGTLPIVPGQGSGALIFATQAANAVNVPVPGPSADANVVGPPHLDLTYRGTAAPQKTWIYAQFANPRNGTVLGNMATPIPLTLDGQEHTISRDLELVAGRAPAGGGYTLQLTASSSLYDLQRSLGAATFDDIHVTMPVGEPVAAPTVVAKHKKKRHKRKHRR